MKKLFALALAVLMMLSLATVAFASETPETQRPTAGTIGEVKGTITINGVTIQDGKTVATYGIYQILKLNSYDFNTGSYFYEYTDDAWEEFFTEGEGGEYITLNDKGLIEWKGSTDADRVAEFAKKALAYANEKNIQPTKSTDTPEGQAAQYTVSGESSIKFEGLELGYYLVDSTVGALCGLSTTNPDGIINSKNGIPTLEKQVQEDLTGQWGKVNSADIGQDVHFRITIHVHDGAQNYKVHDVMEEGFSFNKDSVKVYVVDGASGGDPTEYQPTDTITVNGGTQEIRNYEVLYTDDTFSFDVVFSETFCASLNTNDRLIITYTAMLNRNAEIGNGTAENPSNQNTAHMHYGEGHQTNSDSTTTYTYGFDLVKTDGQNKLLDGSEFRIYSEVTGGSEVTVVPLLNTAGIQMTTEDGYNMYRKARADEPGVTVIVVDGKVRIVGLDNGVYYLEETKAPDGYNAITTRQKFTIADGNLDSIITNGIVSTNSGVQVVNHTGSMLPETGGLGTLLFTLLGGGTALGTGVVLVTKKRMSKIED